MGVGNPLPHEARLRITGWASPVPGGLSIGPFTIRTAHPPESLTRVTLTAYPRTRADGTIKDLFSPRRAIRPARPREANSMTFTATGLLLRASRGNGVVQVKVCPAVSECGPFTISAQATSDILRGLDPATFHVRLTGRVIQAGPGLLLAEQAEVVHAPVPDRWRGHRPRRRASAGLQISPEPFDDMRGVDVSANSTRPEP